MQRIAEFLSKSHNYLSSRKVLNIFLLIVYYVCVVHFHVEVGGFINGIFENVDRSDYNYLIFSLAAVGLTYLVYIFKPHAKSIIDDKHLAAIILFTFLAVVSCFCFLFVINIEAIHFIQYAVFAFFCLPLLRSSSRAILTATIAGAFDELWQYLYLDTRAMYYDFNDVLLDTIGAGIGLVLMKLFYLPSGTSNTPLYRRSEVIGLFIIVVSLIAMWFLGTFSIQPYSDGSLSFFTLLKEIPTDFWTVPNGPYARFHILMPVPGLILIGMSCLVYGVLDKVDYDA